MVSLAGLMIQDLIGEKNQASERYYLHRLIQDHINEHRGVSSVVCKWLWVFF